KTQSDESPVFTAHSEPISRDEARQWIRSSDTELPDLLARARALRDHFKPGVITYSRKVFIPLTNLCRDYCGYCAFRRDPGENGAHTMTPEEVLEVARAGEKLGCTEALFSLGDKPELAFPQMRETFASSATSQPCNIWKQCADWFCGRLRFCRILTPGC